MIYLVGRIQGQYFSPEDDQQAAYQQVGSNSIESGDIPIYRDQTGDQNFVANPQQPTETFGLGDTGNNLFVNNPPVSGNNNNNNPFLGSGGPATFIVEPSIVQPDPTFVSFSTPPVQNVGGVRPSFTTTDIFQPGPPVQGSIAPSFPVFTPQPNVPTIFPPTTQQQQPSAFPNFVPSPPISQQLPPAPAPAPAPAPVQIPLFTPAPAPPAPINNPPFQPPAPVNQVIVNPGVPVPAPPPNTPPVVPPVGGDPGAAANNNNLQCHVRTCDQTITGRNLPYRRALEIVQNEEYLDEADLDLIRRRRRRYRRAEPLGRRVHRQKRQTAGQIIVNIIENDPNAPILAIGAVALGGVGLAALGAGAPAAPPPPPNPPPAQQQQPLRQQITEQNILPGETGGGALPFGTGPVAFEALALVPAGLTAVSVFPPFVNQARQFNAVAVIFRRVELLLLLTS